jgi:adenosine deaminase
MNIKPEVAFLSSSRILEEYYLKSKDFSDSTEKIDYLSSILFLDFHTMNSGMPDYAYKKLIDNFINPDAVTCAFQELLIGSLKKISYEYLYFKNKNAYVNNDRFQDWQNIITYIPPLPILSFALYNKCKESFRFKPEEFIKEVFKQSALPSIYDTELEDFFDRKGLREIHLHLNGTTEADYIWQDALLFPVEFFKNIKKIFKTDNKFIALEQYLQISNLKSEDIYRLLKNAGIIRDGLICTIITANSLKSSIPDNICCFNQYSSMLTQSDVFSGKNPLLFADKIHPMRRVFGHYLSLPDSFDVLADFTPMQYEALFLNYSFSYLEANKDRRFARLFHYYLLVYSFFNKLLVQQISQVGFDQFQKITINELRTQSEKSYKIRYSQLKGMYKDDLAHLEGRFAPKQNSKEMYKLLNSIIKPFEDIQGNQNMKSKKPMWDMPDNKPLHYDMSLVCHFIKFKDDRFKNSESINNIRSIRDIKLRRMILSNIKALLSVCNRNKKYKDYISGFDAAANELHAGPEVFAPAFRYLRFLGFNNFTYHAGEDFIHLISGIRAVYEAIIFLELRGGNRVGHATALGIDPNLWLAKIGNKITMERGEWFDNLIFAYHIISDFGIDFNLGPLKEEIRKQFREIYSPSISSGLLNENFEIFDMVDAWKLRKLDPFLSFPIYYGMAAKRNLSDYCNNYIESGFIFEEFKNIEIKNIKECSKQKEKAFVLFHKYHESAAIKKCKKLIEVDLSQKLFVVDLYSELQKRVIEYMNKKTIAIESMPTSNLRISFYDNYSEHHIFRWLNVDKYSSILSLSTLQSSLPLPLPFVLPTPIICLGSDDPGIFATNIRNEFSHIFIELLNKRKSRKEAMDIIKIIADNNRMFTFKNS